MTRRLSILELRSVRGTGGGPEKTILLGAEGRDRARFDVYFYSMSARRDAWTERFETIATAFRDLTGMTDRAAAQLIAGDDLDLLVDLQAHTRHARPGNRLTLERYLAHEHVIDSYNADLRGVVEDALGVQRRESV